MRILPFILFFGLCACGQNSTKKDLLEHEAWKLNDSAIAIVANAQDYRKAIELLDQATELDSNYYRAYTNKVAFQGILKQFDKALITAKNLNRIRPETPDYYAITGVIYYEMGDSISSQNYFIQAALRYDKVLDTMDKTNKNYKLVLMNKGINLIYSGEQKRGNDILKKLYNEQDDLVFKEGLIMFIDKSKREILDNLNQRK